MAASRADVTRVPLPEGVRAGIMVGRGGHNVKWLHFQSGGAHITVNDTGVVIRAKDSQVRVRALHLVQRQLCAAAKLAAYADLLPMRTDYVLLEPAFGTDPRVCFALRADDTASVTGFRAQLYQLMPSPPCARGHTEGSAGPDSMEGTARAPTAAAAGKEPSSPKSCSSSYMRDGDRERDQDMNTVLPGHGRKSECGEGSVHWRAEFSAPSVPPLSAATAARPAAGGQESLCAAGAALEEAAQLAVRCGSGVDGLKLRFRLGKTLFRNLGPRAPRAVHTVADLEDLCSGRPGAQSTFSGFLPADAVPRVTSWLTEQLGFSLVGSKGSATLHVINQELNVHTSVALEMERVGDDSSAVLRKVKVGGPRCHSVALLGGPEHLDMRLRLMAEPGRGERKSLVNDPDTQSTARRIVDAVRSQGFEGFTRTKRGLPRNRHLEYGRRKVKDVYEGVYQAGPAAGGAGPHRMRVSVMLVQDDSGQHYEVSGSLPDLDFMLRNLLAAGQQKRPGTPSSSPQVGPGADTSSGAPHTGSCTAKGSRRAEGAAGTAGWAASALSTLAAFVTHLNQQVLTPATRAA